MIKFNEHPLIIGLRVFELYTDEIEIASNNGRVFVKLLQKVEMPRDQVASLILLGWGVNSPVDFFIDVAYA